MASVRPAPSVSVAHSPGLSGRTAFDSQMSYAALGALLDSRRISLSHFPTLSMNVPLGWECLVVAKENYIKVTLLGYC